jgi:hypothetical protein
MGYLSMDVVDPPQGAMWGKWNNRSVGQNFVDSMAAGFVNQLENCVERYAIPVAVRKAWLRPTVKPMERINGKRIDQVPTISFTVEGARAIANNELWVLGGNHRRLALAKCMEDLRTELEDKRAFIADLKVELKTEEIEKEKDAEKNKKGKDKMVLSGDEDADAGAGGAKGNKKRRNKSFELKEAEDRVRFLEDKIVTISPKWAIVLYDRGESSPPDLFTCFR